MQAHEGIVKFLIAPKPGGTLTSAQMQYPSNCTADIVLPDGRHETVTAGEYVY